MVSAPRVATFGRSTLTLGVDAPPCRSADFPKEMIQSVPEVRSHVSISVECADRQHRSTFRPRAPNRLDTRDQRSLRRGFASLTWQWSGQQCHCKSHLALSDRAAPDLLLFFNPGRLHATCMRPVPPPSRLSQQGLTCFSQRPRWKDLVCCAGPRHHPVAQEGCGSPLEQCAAHGYAFNLDLATCFSWLHHMRSPRQAHEPVTATTVSTVTPAACRVLPHEPFLASVVFILKFGRGCRALL